MKKESKKNRIKNGQLTIECTKCHKEKEINDFYGDSLQCKECHRKTVTTQSDEKQLAFLINYAEQGYINNKNIPAANLLLKSCKSRYEACKYSKKGYEKVRCDYDNYFVFFAELVEMGQFFKDWKKQTIIYEQNNRENYSRPTIDRVDELMHYTSDNIQCLSLRENTLKAREIASKAIIFKDGTILGMFEFASKNHFNECLSEYVPSSVIKTIKFDTFEIQEILQDTYILLQTKNADTNSNVLTKAKYELSIIYRRYFIDPETMKIVKAVKLGEHKSDVSRLLIK